MEEEIIFPFKSLISVLDLGKLFDIISFHESSKIAI